MIKIQSSYPIDPSSINKLEQETLETTESTAPFDENKLQMMSPEEEQKQRYLQANIHQSTVIEHNGKVIASFGENGWRSFQNNNDFNASYTNMTDTQVIKALKDKYGAALSVKTYPEGQGPTRAEIHEQIHGEKLSFVDNRV